MSGPAGSIIIVATVLLLVVFILVWPLQLAARAMGARRWGAGACLLSLMGASLMQMLGLSVPVYGSLVAFLLSSATFAAILGTDFLRGIGIAVLHTVFSALLVVAAAVTLGGFGIVISFFR